MSKLADPQARSGTAIERFWVAGLIVFVYLSLPVWHPRIFGARLDDSWLATLNHFAFDGLRFGRELVFTYGPLGFLQNPFFYPGTYSLQIAFYLLLGTALALVIREVLPRRGEAGWSLSLVLLFLLSFYLRSPDGYLLVIAAAFALRRSHARAQRISVTDVILLVCLSIASLGKAIHLVAAVLVVVHGAVLARRRGGRLLPIPLIYLAMTGFWFVLLGQRLNDVPAYLVTSWEMVRGYSDVLAGSRSVPGLLLAVACLAGMALVVAADVPRRPSERLWLALALGLLLGIGFKLGLSRPNRTRVASEVLLGVVVLFALHARRHSDRASFRRLAVAAVGVALATHFVVVALNPTLDLVTFNRSEVRRISMSTKRILIGNLLPPYVRLNEIHGEAVERVRRLEPMPESGGPVDVLGWWQGAVLAHGLDLRPRPVFQSQKAYSPRLAEINAEFFRSERAPPFVLVRIEGYQSFHPMSFDGPAQLELLRCYRPRSMKGDYLLLGRGACADLPRRLLVDRPLEFGTRLDLPDHAAEEILWVEVEAERSLAGRGAALLWAPGRLRIDVFPEGGRAHSFLLAPEVGRAGFILSPMVLGTEEFARLYEPAARRTGPPRVAAIALHESGRLAGEFEPRARVRVYAVGSVATGLEPEWQSEVEDVLDDAGGGGDGAAPAGGDGDPPHEPGL